MEKEQTKTFHKRKKINLKVKQDFQIWLLVRILVTSFVTVLLSSLFLYFYAKGIIDAEFLGFNPNVRKVSEVMLPILIAAALTSTFAGLLLALFLPQKIAGPIFRIEQDLMAIREGDLTKRVSLRCADVLKELAESVNMSVNEIGHLVQNAKDSGNELEEKIIAGEMDEIIKAFAHHKEKLERIKTKP